MTIHQVALQWSPTSTLNGKGVYLPHSVMLLPGENSIVLVQRPYIREMMHSALNLFIWAPLIPPTRWSCSQFISIYKSKHINLFQKFIHVKSYDR